jgi:hypothetical protein
VRLRAGESRRASFWAGVGFLKKSRIRFLEKDLVK